MTPETGFSDGFVHASMEEKIGLMTANFSSPSEELSAFFVIHLMGNLNYEKAKKQSSSRSKKALLANEIKTIELELDIARYQLKALQEGYAIASKELGQDTPIITVTERPLLPLEPYLPSLAWFIIKGFIIGIILSAFLLLIFKIISDTLQE